MHSFEGKNGTIIHFNSDMSGDLIIMKPGNIGMDSDGEFDAEDLVECVIEYLRGKAISRIEDMDDNELISNIIKL